MVEGRRLRSERLGDCHGGRVPAASGKGHLAVGGGGLNGGLGLGWGRRDAEAISKMSAKAA